MYWKLSDIPQCRKCDDRDIRHCYEWIPGYKPDEDKQWSKEVVTVMVQNAQVAAQSAAAIGSGITMTLTSSLNHCLSSLSL